MVSPPTQSSTSPRSRWHPLICIISIVTTDKVYRNVNPALGVARVRPVGRVDLYSASKAAADLITQSWMQTSGSHPPTAIARAGNVIRGGDMCRDRLMVDRVAACSAGQPVRIRYPASVRPWHHVLHCLHGCLWLTAALLSGKSSGEAYNFRPGGDSVVRVGDLATTVAALWGTGSPIEVDNEPHVQEGAFLHLASSKAELDPAWRNTATTYQAVAWTVEWEKEVRAGADARATCLAQISKLERLAQIHP